MKGSIPMSEWLTTKHLKHQPIGTRGLIEIHRDKRYEPYISDFLILDKNIYSVTLHAEIRKKTKGGRKPPSINYGRIIVDYDNPDYRIKLSNDPHENETIKKNERIKTNDNKQPNKP